MSGTARWAMPVGLMLLAVLLALPAGCGPAGPAADGSAGTGARAAVPLRPGDSLLGRLDDVMVERYPESNLAPDVAALLASSPDGRLAVRTAELMPAAWTSGRAVPESASPMLAGRKDLRLFHCRPALPSGEAVPTILKDGAVAPGWNAATDPFPGEFVYWDPGQHELCAVGATAPRGIQLAVSVDAAVELGSVELRLGAHGPPAARDLLRRVELGRVSRPCLLLPAPGSVAVAVPALPGNVLAVSVGVLDHCWRAAGGTLQRSLRRSDGATFAIEVEAGGSRQRVWSATLDAQAVGARFEDAEVDLAAYSGRDVVLHLLTEPGPTGDAAFDYAVWSDLRLLGAARPPGARSDRRPNVVIIDADTLRPDRLGCYGSQRPTSPRLDAWAGSSGVRFADVRSTGCYTLPATASMFTGLAVHQHRLGLDLPTLAASSARPLAAILSAAGYETLGIAEGAYLSTAFGFDGGFDVYVTREHKQPQWELARAWLADRRQRSERPVFLFLQTYTVHVPYDYDPRFLDPAAPYRGPLAGAPIDSAGVIDPVRDGQLVLDAADLAYANALYDAGVARMDALAGDVIDTVHEIFADEDVLLIFVADHGEEFLEHGSMAHNHSLYNELLSVPLIIDFPGAGGAATSAVPASLLDVVPTVLDVLGVAVPESLPGRSLHGGSREPRPRIAQYADETHSIELDGLKLIRGPTRLPPKGPAPPNEQLFDLRADPGEHDNLAERQASRVAALSKLLDDWLASWPAPAASSHVDGGIDERTLRDLEALGYVQGDDRR